MPALYRTLTNMPLPNYKGNAATTRFQDKAMDRRKFYRHIAMGAGISMRQAIDAWEAAQEAMYMALLNHETIILRRIGKMGVVHFQHQMYITKGVNQRRISAAYSTPAMLFKRRLWMRIKHKSTVRARNQYPDNIPKEQYFERMLDQDPNYMPNWMKRKIKRDNEKGKHIATIKELRKYR